MYIHPNTNSVAMTGKPVNPRSSKNFVNRIKQKLIDVVPESTFNEGSDTIERIKKIENKMSHPAINRAIMGATAIVTQPAIDYYNHRVDEETRYVSRNRTIAKVLAGAGVGIAVRGSCYEIVHALTNLEGTKKYSKALIPEGWIKSFASNTKKLNNYKNALSTGVAILVMCLTNFLIDAPVTAYLTNRFNAKTKANLMAKQQMKEGNNV